MRATLWKNWRVVISVDQGHSPPGRESFITTRTAAVGETPAEAVSQQALPSRE